MNSSAISLTVFRQILILPATLTDGPAEKISDAIQDIADRLEAGSKWKEIHDHLAYLGEAKDQSAYAEFVYFHAYIQDFLYDKPPTDEKATKRPLRLFQRDDPGTLVVEVSIKKKVLGLGDDDDETSAVVEASLNIERLCLYLFELGVAILVVEVATDFDPMVKEDGASKRLSLAHAQTLQNALRRLYPPYFHPNTDDTFWPNNIPEYPVRREWLNNPVEATKPSQWIEHVAKTRRNPIDPVWSAMLAPLAVEGEPETGFGTWRQIIDERIPSMVFLGVRDGAAIDEGDFARLCFLDEPGAGYPYAKDFLRGYKKKHFNDRHWYGTSGTRYMFSGYSMVMLGTGDPSKKDDYFHYTLAGHFRRHYFQMGLLIQLQFAALLALSHRVSKAVETKKSGGDAEFRKEMLALEGLFLEFEQRYWFSQISNQLQAREMYDLWLERTNVATVYHEVGAQVHAANAWLDVRAQEAQTIAMANLTAVATIGVVLGLALSFLSLNILVNKDLLGLTAAVAFFSGGGCWLSRWLQPGEPQDHWGSKTQKVLGGMFCVAAILAYLAFFLGQAPS